MSTLVGGPADVDLGSICRVLSDFGFEATALQVSGGDLPLRAAEAQAFFLVSPDQGVVTVGERVTQLRRKLGNDLPLIVCCPRPSASDRDELRECGASEIITPEGWSPREVAERIAAELIAAGRITPASFGALLGATSAMRDLYGRLERIAPLEEPVLVLGETGTGKELVAQEIHARSGRDAPLLPINCAALPPELLESELFGHERGAFSGALTARRGLLAEGGSGTVFLDEIGDLPLPAQAKLLRVLEELKVRPVGSNRYQSIQARLVLATNRDLERACAAGTFRLDLFYRISGFMLRLPPLRERKADLLLLARHFLGGFNKKYKREVVAPSGAFDPLFRHDWPGNVRELQKAVWAAAGSANGDRGPISLVTLQEATRRRPTAAATPRTLPFDATVESWKEVHDRIRASYFRSVLRLTGGNKDAAAKRAGVSRSQFYEILKQIEQTPEPERGDNDKE